MAENGATLAVSQQMLCQSARPGDVSHLWCQRHYSSDRTFERAQPSSREQVGLLARTSSLLATWRFSPVGEGVNANGVSSPIRARESAVTIRTMRSSGAGVSALVDTRLSCSRPINAAAGSKPGRPRERHSPLRHPFGRGRCPRPTLPRPLPSRARLSPRRRSPAAFRSSSAFSP